MKICAIKKDNKCLKSKINEPKTPTTSLSFDLSGRGIEICWKH